MAAFAAGILCYSHDPNGNTVFLLGKDFKNKYSDFGGKNEPHETNTRDTASREFYEESCGVIYDIVKTKSILQNCQVVITETYLKKPYYMFLLWIPYKKEYIDNFNMIKNNIRFLSIDRKFKEKNYLKWFSIDEIVKNSCDMRQIFYKTFMSKFDLIKFLSSRKVFK